MPIKFSMRAALAVCVPVLSTIAFAADAPGASAAALAELRVEGPDSTLDPGTWYVTGTERIRRSKPSDACVRTDGRIRVPGPTAQGLPQTGARTDDALRQVRVRRDEAGVFTCEIGSIIGRPFSHPAGFAGWSYYEDYVFGSAAADQVRLEDGDRIMWAYSDFGAGTPANTGSALELQQVPAGDTDGSFQVKVVAHSFDGSEVVVNDATIEGATATPTGSNGIYNMTAPQGMTTLRATREIPPDTYDIPSNRMTVCVQPQASDCPSAHGRTVVGSFRDEDLDGTAGWDVITTLGGRDRVDLRQGGRDEVSCGAGDDLVVVAAGDADDEIAPSCERVRRPTG